MSVFDLFKMFMIFLKNKRLFDRNSKRGNYFFFFLRQKAKKTKIDIKI